MELTREEKINLRQELLVITTSKYWKENPECVRKVKEIKMKLGVEETEEGKR